MKIRPSIHQVLPTIRHCSECCTVRTQVIVTTTPRVGSGITPISQRRQRRLREVEWFALAFGLWVWSCAEDSVRVPSRRAHRTQRVPWSWQRYTKQDQQRGEVPGCLLLGVSPGKTRSKLPRVLAPRSHMDALISLSNKGGNTCETLSTGSH